MIIVTLSVGAAASPSFTGQDPMFQWVGWVHQQSWTCADSDATCRLASAVSFEGARVPPGEWTLPPMDGADAVAAVDTLGRTAYPARFEVREASGRRVLVPITAQDELGTWVPVRPRLDTPIGVPTGARPTEQALQEWIDALAAATGERIVLGQSWNGTTSAGGTGTAREILIAILDAPVPLDERSPPPVLVWRLVWYEGGQHWILNVARLWALETPWGLPRR